MANKLIKNSGNGRYLVTKSFVTTSYTAWTIQLKIITETTLNACTLVNTVANDQEVKCFRLDLNANGSLNLKINTGVSGDNWTSDQTSSIYLETNTEYWLRIKYTNTQDYTVEYSIDGTTYISTGILITSANPCYYTANQYINFIPSIDDIYFNGTFDTSEIQIVYNSGGSDVTLFDGATASNAGIYNVGSTITGNIATFTGVDTYIKCNGMMLGNDNVSLISKIKIVSLPNGNEKQPIFVNANGQGIYLILEDGYYKLSLKLSDTYSISLPINTEREFWIGYYYKNSIPYFGILPYSYYSAFEGLPAFGDTQCTKDWNLQGQQGGGENWIKDCILIGADSNYYFKGEIDLSKTFLSNNLGSYNVNKIGYLPSTGTRLVDSDVSVSSVELTSMYKITIASQDSSGNPLDTDIKIDFTSIRNDYNNYYQRVSDTEVWVPTGSYLKNNKGVVIKDNVTQTETVVTTFYTISIYPDVRTIIGMTVNPRVSVLVTNSYNNYFLTIDPGVEYQVPGGSNLTYTINGPEGSTGYVQTVDTISTITEDKSLYPRLKYKNTFSSYTVDGFGGRYNVLNYIVAGPGDTRYKFTMHGRVGQLPSHGGYAEATYDISGGVRVGAWFFLGGYSSNIPNYLGVGSGILAAGTPLIIAGGAGVKLPSGSHFGGGGYNGGYGSDGNGYSWDGTQGNSQTDPTINANGGTNDGAYGGTGGTYTVSGTTLIGQATLIPNDSTYEQNYAYITIEEI